MLVDDERLTVIDFGDCGFSWFMYDRACALTFNEGRADVEDLIARWVDGYRSIEPLAPPDEEEIPNLPDAATAPAERSCGAAPRHRSARELGEAGFAGESCVLAEGYLGRFG